MKSSERWWSCRKTQHWRSKGEKPGDLRMTAARSWGVVSHEGSGVAWAWNWKLGRVREVTLVMRSNTHPTPRPGDMREDRRETAIPLRGLKGSSVLRKMPDLCYNKMLKESSENEWRMWGILLIWWIMSFRGQNTVGGFESLGRWETWNQISKWTGRSWWESRYCRSGTSCVDSCK